VCYTSWLIAQTPVPVTELVRKTTSVDVILIMGMQIVLHALALLELTSEVVKLNNVPDVEPVTKRTVTANVTLDMKVKTVEELLALTNAPDMVHALEVEQMDNVHAHVTSVTLVQIALVAFAQLVTIL